MHIKLCLHNIRYQILICTLKRYLQSICYHTADMTIDWYGIEYESAWLMENKKAKAMREDKKIRDIIIAN